MLSLLCGLVQHTGPRKRLTEGTTPLVLWNILVAEHAEETARTKRVLTALEMISMSDPDYSLRPLSSGSPDSAVSCLAVLRVVVVLPNLFCDVLWNAIHRTGCRPLS